ncbi:DUF5789 family protein [Natronosalvus halobius]|uniref:DUF5789 family protein n=1 Tax=Natronosalvus halobius TaxID=2953746 RepID=UPI0020A15840|nr:hypothetical protein [Natronosalvus halobius]USZ71145.1 hypothetical protein NGM15_13790 [Natronosalvus halobius]
MSEDSRELGIELGALQDELKDHDYPVSQDELLENHGDIELDMGEETATLEELIGPLNEDEYQSYEEVEQAVMNMVGDEAIGRKNYSDRTPPAPGEERQKDNPSGEDVQSENESF